MATNPRPIPHDVDPLDYEKVPSVSFRDAEVGTFYEGIIVKKPTLAQSRDYESGEPATWSDGNPKLSVVIQLELSNGETRSLWAPKPSAMFAALVAAQKEAGGHPMQVGGTLGVKYTGSVPNAKNSKLNPTKQYVCRYSPPLQDALQETPPAATVAPSDRAAPAAWGRPAAVPSSSAPQAPRPSNKW